MELMELIQMEVELTELMEMETMESNHTEKQE